MTFELQLDNGKILKGIINTLSSFIDETVIKVTPDAMIFQAMDPSRICLLKLTLNKEDFDGYICADTYKLGINLDDLNKIMKRCAPTDNIKITYDDDAVKLKVIMKRKNAKRHRTFSLALMDLEMEDIPMDNLMKLEYDSSWLMDIGILTEAIKDAEIYSEILSVYFDEDNGIVFSSIGQIGEVTYKLGIDELEESDINGSGEGSYSIRFLKSILNFASITKELEVSLITDHPFKMIFTLTNNAEVQYFLAPRVEEPDAYDPDDPDDF